MHYEVSQDTDFFNKLAGIKLRFKVAPGEADQIEEASSKSAKVVVKSFNIDIADFKEGQGETVIENFRKKACKYLTKDEDNRDQLPPEIHSKVVLVDIQNAK